MEKLKINFNFLDKVEFLCASFDWRYGLTQAMTEY